MFKTIIIILIFSSCIFPETYYVDQNNSGNGTGTDGDPWKDFTKFDINQDVEPGSTINIRPGIYAAGAGEEQIINIISNYDLIIMKDEKYQGQVIFEGNRLGVTLTQCSQDPARVSNSTQYTRFGIRIGEEGANNITIQDISFQNFRENAIKLYASYFPSSLDKIKIYNCSIQNIIGRFNESDPCNSEPLYTTSCAAIIAQNMTDLEISNCTITLNYPSYNNKRAAQTDGIFMGGVQTANIHDNVISLRNDFTTHYSGVPSSVQQPHIDAIQGAASVIPPLEFTIYCKDIIISHNTIENLSQLDETFDTDLYYSNRQGIYLEQRYRIL